MSKFNTYSVDSYVSAGLSEKEAEIKVEQNKANTSRGIRLSLLSQTLNRLKIKNNCYSLEQLLYIVDEFVDTHPHISSTRFWKIIKKIQIYQDADIDKCIEHLKEGMDLFANYKTQFRSSDFLKFLYGKESIEYKNKLLHNKSYASCSKEKFLEKYEDKAEGLRQFKIKYASNSLEHLVAKHNITEDEAREIVNSRSQKGNNTFNSKSDEEKARINKSKGQSLETLISKFGSKLGAIKYKEMCENRKGQTSLSFYIKKYGDIDGPKIYHEKKGKHNSYYCIEYWLKQGMEEELAKSKIRELFESRPNFSKVYCIKKYGETKGTHVWKLRNEIWQTTLNSKSDEEKARINKSKAITLENFIKKYGEIDGPLRFESRKIGGGCVSLESKKFFIQLYKNLRRLDIIKKKDVYFGLKGSKEYFIKTKNSIRFYDFTILPLKIIVEYNGILYHPKPGETNWKNPFGRTYEEAYQYDLEKIKLAEEKGFKVYSVWSDEDLTESLYNITMLITDIRDHIKGDKFE